MAEQPKEIISGAEVAKRLGLTDGRIRQMARSGELPGFQMARRWFFHESDVDNYIRQRRPELLEAEKT